MPAAIGLSKGFRGLKTVGWKWHKTRRLDPTRVGRHWEPGHLRRPPAELTAAQQAALPPRLHSLLQQGVALRRCLLLRGYLWACVWLRPTPGPDFRGRLRRVDPGGT